MKHVGSKDEASPSQLKGLFHQLERRIFDDSIKKSNSNKKYIASISFLKFKNSKNENYQPPFVDTWPMDHGFGQI
jgi:hypothetical protein